ncbi:PAS domain-containing sensor histidine kinase [Geomonas limicola]|nr:PAS domain-containing protein [Geomonas limicola]
MTTPNTTNPQLLLEIAQLKERLHHLEAQVHCGDTSNRDPFRDLAQAAAQVIWETDASGVALDDAASWRAYTGQTLEELLDNGWVQAVHPEDRTELQLRWQEALATGNTFNAEYRLANAQGVWRWTNVIAVPLLDASGCAVKWTGINLDIHERKQAELAVRANEEGLRLALSGGGLWMWDWHFSDDNVIWSDELYRMLGYAEGEVEAGIAAWEERVHPEDREQAASALRLAMDESNEYEIAFRVLWPDGTVRWLEGKGRIDRDEQGVALRCYGIMHDLTSQHREEELQQSDERLRALLDFVPSLVFLKDPEGRYVYLNETYQKHFLKGRPWIGQTDFDFWDRQTAEIFRANDAEVLRTNRANQFMEDSRDQDGTRRCWLCYKFPLTDSKGNLFLGGVGIDVTERALAQEAVQRSEDRFQLASRAGRIMVYDLDVGSGRVAARHGLNELLGFEPSEAEATLSWWDGRIHPDDLPACHAAFGRLKTGSHDHVLCYRVRHKDGRTLWVEDHATAFYTDAGGLRRVIGSVRDITDHKHTEEALRESNAQLKHSEERFRALALATSDSIFRMSPDWKEMFYLQGHKFLADTEVATSDWLERYIFAADRPLVTAAIEEAIRTKGMFEQEHRVRRADGGTGWTLSRAIPMLDSQGEIVEWFGAAKNITDRKLAEEREQRSYERLVTLMNALPVGVSFSDDETCRNITGNPTFLQQFGIGAQDNISASAANEDAPGRQMSYLLDGRPLTPAELPLQRAVAENRNIPPMEFEVVPAGGKPWVASASAAPVRDQDGKVVCGVAVTVDITDRVNAERALITLNADLERRVQERTSQLAATNKELESFSYSVTHELGAPLRSMNCFSSILLEDYRDRLDDEGRGYLGRIAAAANRMGALIEDLLTLSRVTRRPLSRQTVNLSILAQEILLGLVAQDPERQVELDVVPGVEGEWDPAMVKLILQNLLSNAWKYTGGTTGAKIQFGGYRKGAGRVFYVRDNGIGFDMTYASKIFLPFERLHRGEFEGTGIGLATVQRVIDLHGGRIWTEARLGEGATFFFTDQGSAEEVPGVGA